MPRIFNINELFFVMYNMLDFTCVFLSSTLVKEPSNNMHFKLYVHLLLRILSNRFRWLWQNMAACLGHALPSKSSRGHIRPLAMMSLKVGKSHYGYDQHAIEFKASVFVYGSLFYFIRSTRSSHLITQDQSKNKIVNTVMKQNSKLVIMWAKMMWKCEI